MPISGENSTEPAGSNSASVLSSCYSPYCFCSIFDCFCGMWALLCVHSCGEQPVRHQQRMADIPNSPPHGVIFQSGLQQFAANPHSWYGCTIALLRRLWLLQLEDGYSRCILKLYLPTVADFFLRFCFRVHFVDVKQQLQLPLQYFGTKTGKFPSTAYRGSLRPPALQAVADGSRMGMELPAQKEHVR